MPLSVLVLQSAQTVLFCFLTPFCLIVSLFDIPGLRSTSSDVE